MQPLGSSSLSVRIPQNQPNPPLVYLEPVDTTGGDESDASGLLEFWHLIRFRKWTIFSFVMVGLLATLLISLLETPTYQSRTTVEIQGIPENTASVRIGPPDGGRATLPAESYIQTQAKVLQSKALFDTVTSRLQSSEAKWSSRPDTRLKTMSNAMGIAIPFPNLEPSPVSAKVDLKVKVVENTRMIEILVDSPDPNLSATFANTLVREYVDSGMTARWDAAQRNSQWISKQLVDIKEKLHKSEKELQDYRTAAGLMLTPDKQSDVQVESLMRIQDELARAQADRMAKQSVHEVTSSGPIDAMPQVMDNTRLSGYQSRLADLRRELADLSSQLTPEHYKVKRVQAQINELEGTLKREREAVLLRVNNDYKAAERRERLLQAAFASQAAVVVYKTSKAFTNDLITQEVNSLRQMYDELLRKLKEVAIASTLSTSLVRVVDAAEPAAIPYKPDLLRNLAMGLLSSLMLGIGFVFAGDYVNRRVKAPGETPFHLRVPELGVIPEQRSITSGSAARRGTASIWVSSNENKATRERVELVTWQDRPSLMAESFRNALASILSGGRLRRRPHVIIMTSPSRGDGKSTTACNVGLALAEINQRVLLIDADMRKPQLHNIFGLTNNWGLSDLLRERTPLAEVPLESLARETEISGLYVLPSGPGTASISNLLYSDRMAELLVRFRNEFDTVILDTPPMLFVADARVLGRLADAAILVLRAGKTTRDEALRSKQQMVEDGIELLGTILNGWDLKAKTRYGYSTYSEYGINGS